ncbi:TPA: hypothetical protein JAX37_003342 [Enterobacter cloacae]|nr:hypothetical protein [Enterobacter cloacae]
MKITSPVANYTEHQLLSLSSISSVCGYDDNCRTIETSDGYVLINVNTKPRTGDTVLLTFYGRMDLAKVQGNALITQDGEDIEGDSLDDVNIVGVVTFFLNRITETDNNPVI